jgi:hypothetical protein
LLLQLDWRVELSEVSVSSALPPPLCARVFIFGQEGTLKKVRKRFEKIGFSESKSSESGKNKDLIHLILCHPFFFIYRTNKAVSWKRTGVIFLIKLLSEVLYHRFFLGFQFIWSETN